MNGNMSTSSRTPRTTETTQRPTDFKAIRISVASPDQILEWSYGEVTKPETINYRTQKPERDGLFDERIFGPTRDWECYCGKYKKIRYKGVICDRCGVEVTRSSVRRERMGHIDLAAPVSHIWYVRGVPSTLGLVLDLSITDLERVIYFAGFLILEVNQDVKQASLDQLDHEYKDLRAQLIKAHGTPQSPEVLHLDAQFKATKAEIESLQVKKVISEARYHEISLKYGAIIRVGIGAEAIADLLKEFSIDTEIDMLQKHSQNSQGATLRRVLKRLTILNSMKAAGINPAWLVLNRLPVIPPDLRPMVQLDGGRFATSDLNDLYRRVLNRNNRLKRLLAQGAPEVIIRNEKRMLQEAVDSLVDNSARRGRGVATGTAQRKLRSLSDMLRGKQGRFRQNLLGKRVDYSGRSVIVVGPKLELNQCGLPKTMALELFKPFVISKLIEEGHVHNVRNATRLIERGTPEVWAILERITVEHYVLLNRAPTLHRLGIQAFHPVLIEGKAIQLHPLVCSAYNADFDGDQMAVHVPLSSQARKEAESIMQSTKNLLKPASGEPIVSPRLDMVFGCYYLTQLETGRVGEGKIFASTDEALMAWQRGIVHLRAPIKVKVKADVVETSMGRLIFNEALPEELPYVNDTMDAKKLKKLIANVYRNLGQAKTAALVDELKNLGFKFAELSGMTISISDIVIPQAKPQLIADAEKQQAQITQRYRRGLITARERIMATLTLWQSLRDTLSKQISEEFSPYNPVAIMLNSGARGNITQLSQLGGLKGLVVNPSGEIIEVPITHNFKEGLSVYEYFISTHAARKGRSDTALRTSDAGYLTRRLVDVAQDVIINTIDCGATEGIVFTRAETDELAMNFGERLLGRVAFEPITLPGEKKPFVEKGEVIDEEKAHKIAEAGVESVTLRSPLYCQDGHGLCRYCYGLDLGTGHLVRRGEAIGIMAAQAIGEPGTQLTMRTFHMGGVSGADITSGLPRVEELFEARMPGEPAILAEIGGRVEITENKETRTVAIYSDKVSVESIEVHDPYEITVANGDIVKSKQAIATATDRKAIRSPLGGTVSIKGNTVTITALEAMKREYIIPSTVNLKIADGQLVEMGTELTEGHLDLHQSLDLRGPSATQKYIIQGVQEVYASQGQSINDKHIEIIIRRMCAKSKVVDPADSLYLQGQLVDRLEIERVNAERALEKKRPVTIAPSIMGITRVALKTDSFLSAASFQETSTVLIDAAIRGVVDPLRGLKENVIIGKLIPAGTGHPGWHEDVDLV
ncbi:MAG TPA: DNA-directed RNA polymerase subunit beta' [Patescibacteria group bacterium]